MSSKKIFFIALFFYIFISPFFYHPDIKTIFYQSQFLSKGVINIYSFLVSHPEGILSGPFVYPPLAYYIFGLISIPLKLIAGNGFARWLFMGNDAVWVDNIYRYIFVMKIPALIAFFATGVVLAKLVEVKSSRSNILLFWFFNPISIYVVGFMAQIDIVAVLLTVFALFYARRKPYFSSFLLGLGALTKSYPLILLPFFSLLISKDWRTQLKTFLIGFITYLIGISYFLTTPAFYDSTFISGLSQRIFEAGIGLGFGENILIIPLVLFFLFFYLFDKDSGNTKKIYSYFFLILTMVVVATHFHPQWVLWLVPFLSLGIFNREGSVKKGVIVPVVLFFVGYLGTILLINDTFLSWGLISPLDGGVMFLPTIYQMLSQYMDAALIQNLFHTLMFSSGLFLALKLIYEKENSF